MAPVRSLIVNRDRRIRVMANQGRSPQDQRSKPRFLRVFLAPWLMVGLVSCGPVSAADKKKEEFCSSLQSVIWDLTLERWSMTEFLAAHVELSSKYTDYFALAVAEDPAASEEASVWRDVSKHYVLWPSKYPGPPNAVGTFAYQYFSDQACGTDFEGGGAS